MNKEETSAGYVMVPVEPTPEMLDCIMDWQKIGNVTAYRAMLAAAPKAEQPPVQEPVAEVALSDDGYKIGLLCALRNHRLPIGTKLYAAPQPVSDDARDALVDVLNELLHQIDINDFVDSHGHSAKMLKAVHDGMKAVAAYRAAMGSKGE